MCNNLLPMNTPNPDRKHRRHSKSWKATSKRCHQYKRMASITVLPGWAILDDLGAYIIPFNEVVTYA